MNTNIHAITKPPPGLPPLPLSQNETGSLATAPLSTVVNSATDALYQDLYNLVHGDIKIVSVANAAAAGEGDGGGGASTAASGAGSVNSNTGGGVPEAHAAASVEEKLTAAALGGGGGGANGDSPAAPPGPADALLETRKRRMANLSFAQRRHELSRRIAQHARSIAHVHALAAASLPKSHSALLRQRALSRAQHHARDADAVSGAAGEHDPPPRLGAVVQASSDALRFVKSGWVSQDEAQDALYFHHDGLWKARAHCHDVLGALCVISSPMADDSVVGDVGDRSKEDDEGGGAMRVENKTSFAVTKRGWGGRWPDFPSDVALAVDKYGTSKENAYSLSELRARLASAVTRKLVLGEVGAFGTLDSASGEENRLPPMNFFSRRGGWESRPLPWRIVLGEGGRLVRLTHGAPRTVSTGKALRQRSPAVDAGIMSDDDAGDGDEEPSGPKLYPMEASLSVLSESPSAAWKLLSIRVRYSPKTGESDHQLVMNRKQMFDLHRIGERAMLVEEAVCKKFNKGKSKNEMKGDMLAITNEGEYSVAARQPVVPRPLLRLFEVVHAFALSLQMEVLSSQAEAMRRGAWGGLEDVGTGAGAARTGAGAMGASDEGITVSPLHFFYEGGGNDGGENKAGISGCGLSHIAVMAVHFWSCDDRHGSPRVGDLSTCEDMKNGNKESNSASSLASKNQKDDNFLPKSDRCGEQRLSLCIRAVTTVGLVVSLSGGSGMVSNGRTKGDFHGAVGRHTQRHVEKLLSSIQDPFQLSMSDALLAATMLCAGCRCRAVVGALNRQMASTHELPKWIHLTAECGTISIAAAITYPSSSLEAGRAPTVLFRLACDSRTGRFTPVFPRPAQLLGLLACNEALAGDARPLCGTVASSATGARPAASGGSGGGAGGGNGALPQSTARIVRDTFDALSRSVDTLGRKCGVGGEWNDVDVAQSSSLREKSIGQTCRDVRASLFDCCGMVAVFGIGAMALRIAGGVDPMLDAAGCPISDESIPDLIRAPPLSVVLRQHIVEKVVKEGDGETKRLSQLQGELFAILARVNEKSLELVCFDVLTISESASSVPTRLGYAKVNPPELTDTVEIANSTRPMKRPRAGKESSKCHHILEEVEHATNWVHASLQQ